MYTVFLFVLSGPPSSHLSSLRLTILIDIHTRMFRANQLIHAKIQIQSR